MKLKKILVLFLTVLMLCPSLIVPAASVNYDGTVTVASATANRNGEVTVAVTLSGCKALKSMMLKNLTYDSTNLELVSGSWKTEDIAISSNQLPSGKVSSMALSENTDINGTVYELKFKVKSAAAFKEYPIGITVLANYMDTDKADKPVTLNVVSGKITVACVHSYSEEWVTDSANHWHECSVCSGIKDSAAHTFEWKIDSAATENATGLKHEECTVCGYKRNENTVIAKLEHTHSMTHTAAVAASCKAEGNIEYWYCTVCKKYFSDSAGTTEITQSQTVIAKKSHTASSVWTSDADYHWHACTGCTEKLNKSSHTYEWVTDTEPTVLKTGTRHEECTICHNKRNEGTVIPKIGDVNADGAVNSDDAIQLLNHTLNPAKYTVTGKCDFDGDSVITSDDAIYLLNYTLNPNGYPIS